MKNGPKKMVSVIIPAYKQEKTILNDIRNIDDVMSKTRFNYEVIVVVDGYFLDQTFENATKLRRKNVKILGYKNNKGKGYAIRYGMARSKGDYIVFIDAGMDIDPNGISLILEHLEWYDADIMVGSKRHPASKINYPLIRKIYSWGYYLFVKTLLGVRVRDTQAGLKVFKREVLEKVLPRLLVKEFAFDIEILAVSRYLGFNKIYESPIYLNWDEFNTTFTPFLIFDKHIRSMIKDTLAVFYRLRILDYYSDNKKRKWVYDKELDMKINTGETVNA
ncbi:glycosyltransferase [Patescibacteria group bacterium]|nr:glycosyltransferase [Patescibacteria group bacterium]